MRYTIAIVAAIAVTSALPTLAEQAHSDNSIRGPSASRLRARARTHVVGRPKRKHSILRTAGHALRGQASGVRDSAIDQLHTSVKNRIEDAGGRVKDKVTHRIDRVVGGRKPSVNPEDDASGSELSTDNDDTEGTDNDDTEGSEDEDEGVPKSPVSKAKKHATLKRSFVPRAEQKDMTAIWAWAESKPQAQMDQFQSSVDQILTDAGFTRTSNGTDVQTRGILGILGKVALSVAFSAFGDFAAGKIKGDNNQRRAVDYESETQDEGEGLNELD